MNWTNALCFLVIGVALLLTPFAAPGMFPHTAIDGSSTRALWVELMGAAQAVLGGALLLRPCFRRIVAVSETSPAAVRMLRARERNDWATVAAASEPVAASFNEAGAVTLRGEHADLWRAFARALRHDADARHLAARLVELAKADGDGATEVAGNVVAFCDSAHPVRVDDLDATTVA